ncbi:hypothetical protein KIN20_012844 [Parelaphostrongylus tenuis]|uniref:K Homology domain-containing protein n=1 Tax=Parelaphostrongylus tenuis TaxID=148309 RepID=A0AAD5MV85_PARTN|nr:hypothetical protein KIN20_012844 [Parelaphostrongylus tenuis]
MVRIRSDARSPLKGIQLERIRRNGANSQYQSHRNEMSSQIRINADNNKSHCSEWTEFSETSQRKSPLPMFDVARDDQYELQQTMSHTLFKPSDSTQFSASSFPNAGRRNESKQTMEHVELPRHIRADYDFAAHADKLVLNFIVLELTEPPPAQLARLTGDEAYLQFIRKTFDKNPVLEELAAHVVPKQLGANIQQNLAHHHGNADDSTSYVAGIQDKRLLQLINKVLERRNISSQNSHAQTKLRRSMRTQSTDNVLQQQVKSANISDQRENCVSNRQFTHGISLTQTISIEQNSNGLTIQHGKDPIKAPSNVDTIPVARQELQIPLYSEIIEKETFNGVTMSMKIYIPSPPPGTKCNYVGRIIGPNGMTIRDLQLETGCQISIRGKGTVKDKKLLRKLHRRGRLEHLKEDTHVLIEAESPSRDGCRFLIENAKKRISKLFTPEFDDLKRQQLSDLAVVRGACKLISLSQST